ncbi:hypothetical protein T296_05005 [Pantoea agglomerans Eh318]|jgi:hypothetical protein|nr:hypothetical protein T296_05005 [Pantoea agglomerans Eh318]
MLSGCMVLIPDSREETRLRYEQARRVTEQTRKQALARLPQVSG